MRPTDENQPRSRRPNLMSPSRRTSGDIPILAMLDGRASGRRSGARPRLLWYGAGGMLACALLAVLAWLVRGTARERDAASPFVAAVTPAPPAARPESTGWSPRASTPITEAVQERNTHGAAVVDLTQTGPAVPSSVVSVAPSAPPAGRRADAPAARSAQEVAPGTAGALRAPRIAAAAPVVASAASATPATPPRPVPARRAASRPGPLRTSTQVAAQAPSPAHADARAARHKRSPAATRAPAQVPSNVDTDVAVISAILLHTGTRAGGDAADAAATAPCADSSCDPHMPSR